MSAAHEPVATTAPVASTIVAALRAEGVDRVFCVAGESYLPLLDALREAADIDVVTCRHEGSAGFAAIADAKLTGRVGVCLVSRAPGATNASIAVHAALQEATPLLVLVGQVPVRQLGQQAFQEIDTGATFTGMAKASWLLHEPAGTAGLVRRALYRARSGTPGPVVLAVPEDVCGSELPVGRAEADPPAVHPAGTVAETAVLETARRLAAARRPLLLAGGRLATPAGRAALAAAALEHDLPVVCSNKHQDLLDNTDHRYAGHLCNTTPGRQRSALAMSDLVLAVGTRLDQVTTQGHRFPAAPVPEQPLIHVYPDPERVGEVYQPALGLCADPTAFLWQLSRCPPAGVGPHRREWVRALRQLEQEQGRWRPTAAPDGVVFGEVVATLDRLTGGRCVVALDAGGFTSWVYRYLRLRNGAAMLGIASSAMGFGVPAAVAAAQRIQDRPVIAIVGDGGFLMNGSELATAVARNLRLVVVVANNSSYGTIRHHQERRYPGRSIATDLVNPDFARLGEAYGALGLTAQTDADVEPALAKALDHTGPALVEVRTSLFHFSANHPLGGETPS